MANKKKEQTTTFSSNLRISPPACKNFKTREDQYFFHLLVRTIVSCQVPENKKEEVI